MAALGGKEKISTTMVSSRSEYGNTETSSDSNAPEVKKISEYEQSREERIKENRERMQKLGIFDLSLQVKARKPTTRSRKPPSARSTPRNSSPLACSGPVRRSSRLQSVTPVSYSEALTTKKDKSLSSKAVLLREEGARPEFYTEEHDKMLGSTEMEWTLFVDGVGKDGKRIYDPVKGKTCHQCRQKTLGLRTHCSNCNIVQGQFCGDCLYMRYGENVIEANQNPNWICPVCRGICNCSLCRQAKGWPPTGPLYRKITSLGYKSVAHFLIQTRRLKTKTETDSVDSKAQVSVKRSLASAFTEETSTEMLLTDFNGGPQVFKSPKHHEGENIGTLPCDNPDEKIYFSDGGDGNFKQVDKTNMSDKELDDCKKEEEKIQFLDTEQGQLGQGMMKPDMNAELPLHLGLKEKETDILVDKHDCNIVPDEDNGFIGKAGLSGSFQIELAIEIINCEFNGKKQQDKSSFAIGNNNIDCTIAADDSIAGRLTVKHNRGNYHRSTGAGNDGTLGANDTLPQCSADNPNSSSQANISKRLRKSCNESQVQEMNKFSSSSPKADTSTTTSDIPSPVAAVTRLKSKRNPSRPSEPHPDDSIAARLRQRRVQTGGGPKGRRDPC